MSTLGHPISDLAHLLLGQTLVSVGCIISKSQPFIDDNTPGLPTADQVVRWYRDYTGWDGRRDFGWAAAFDCFKSSIISQGVKARIATGQHNSAMADDYIQLAAPLAEAARRLVDRIIGIREPGMDYAGGSSIKIMSML
jgi:aminoglycoside phosphotransferase (APT) family kinase protein